MSGKRVKQMRVRTALRGGESLDACERNIEYWQKDFKRSWNLAQQNASWITDSGDIDYGDLRRSRR